MCIIGRNVTTYQYLPHVLPKLSFVVNSSDNWPADPPSPVPFNWCHQLFMRVGSEFKTSTTYVLRVWCEKKFAIHFHSVLHQFFFTNFFWVLYKRGGFWIWALAPNKCETEWQKFFRIRFCNYILEWLSIFYRLGWSIINGNIYFSANVKTLIFEYFWSWWKQHTA